MKFEFSRQICETYSSIKINQNSFGGSRDIPCGPAGGQMTKPMVAVPSFVDSPESVDRRAIGREASSSAVSVSENRQQWPLKIVSA